MTNFYYKIICFFYAGTALLNILPLFVKDFMRKVDCFYIFIGYTHFLIVEVMVCGLET